MREHLSNPPDGGWGWVVCGASFGCLLMMQGLVFSLGLIYVDLLEYYRESPSLTATVSSVFTGFVMLVGPLVGALIGCFGLRPVAMFGGLLFGTAVATSILSPNITVMIFVFGVAGGIVTGMVFLPAQLAVGVYFDKKKGLAYGISNCGTGIGGSLGPLLYSFLEQEYTWKGALLIFGGIFLNCTVFGSFFRPLKRAEDLPVVYTITTSEEQLITRDQTVEVQVREGIRRQEQEKRELGSDQTQEQHQQQDQYQQQQQQQQQTTKNPHKEQHNHHHNNHEQQQQQQQQQHQQQTSLATNSIDSRLPVLHGLNNDRTTHVERGDGGDKEGVEEKKTNALSWASSFLRKAYRRLGIDLLVSPMFLVVLFIMMLWASHITLLIFLPHYCTLIGLSDSQVTLMMTMIGVTITLTPPVFGLVADKLFQVIWVFTGLLTIGSLSAALMPFTTHYEYLMAESVGFGASFGSCLSLRQVVLLEQFGSRELPKALGLTNMFQGLVGSPIGGRLYEHTGSYKEPFLVVGAAFALAAVLCIPVGCLRKRHSKQLDPTDSVLNS